MTLSVALVVVDSLRSNHYYMSNGRTSTPVPLTHAGASVPRSNHVIAQIVNCWCWSRAQAAQIQRSWASSGVISATFSTASRVNKTGGASIDQKRMTDVISLAMLTAKSLLYIIGIHGAHERSLDKCIPSLVLDLPFPFLLLVLLVLPTFSQHTVVLLAIITVPGRNA